MCFKIYFLFQRTNKPKNTHNKPLIQGILVILCRNTVLIYILIHIHIYYIQFIYIMNVPLHRGTYKMAIYR